MKYTSLFLTGFFIITLFSCQNKSDISTVEIETSLNIDIPIIAKSNINTKSAGNITTKDYTFEGACSFALSDVVNSQSEIYYIKNIDLINGSVLSFSGIDANTEIYSLNLEWGYKSSPNEDYVMQEPINLLMYENTLSGETFSVNMDGALTQMISNMNSNRYKTYTVKITGESNVDIRNIAKLDVPVVIETERFSAHFELF